MEPINKKWISKDTEVDYFEITNNAFFKYIDYFKTLYSSRFKLKKNDKKLTQKLFRTLQELAFEYGTVGIAKTGNGDLIPVIVTVLARNGEGKPIAATYYTLSLIKEENKFMAVADYNFNIENITGNKKDKNKIDIENIATLDFRTTLYYSSKSALDLFNTNFTQLAFLDGQISKAINFSNDKFYVNKKTTNKIQFEKDLNNPFKTVITSGDGGSGNSMSGFSGDINNAIEGETASGVLAEKVARLDTKLNLKELIEQQEKLLKTTKIIMGIRLNTALGNKSRTNTTESIQEETQFALAEKRQQDVLEDFINQYNKLNGTKLEIESEVIGNLSMEEKTLNQTVDNLDVKNK